MGKKGVRRRDSGEVLAGDLYDTDDLEPVSGRLLEDARLAAGLTVEDAAALLKVDRHHYERMEQGLIGSAFAEKATRILSGQEPQESEDNMTNNDNGTDVQAATKAARAALDEFERLNAEAMTLAQQFDGALDRLLSLGEPLEAALKARYQAYVRAVQAERARARAAGEDVSHEDAIQVKRWAIAPKVPQGVVNRIDLNCEYSIMVPTDAEPWYKPSEAVEYLPVARETPMSARERRRQSAAEGR